MAGSTGMGPAIGVSDQRGTAHRGPFHPILGRPARLHRAELLRRNDVHRASCHVQEGGGRRHLRRRSHPRRRHLRRGHHHHRHCGQRLRHPPDLTVMQSQAIDPTALNYLPDTPEARRPELTCTGGPGVPSGSWSWKSRGSWWTVSSAGGRRSARRARVRTRARWRPRPVRRALLADLAAHARQARRHDVLSRAAYRAHAAAGRYPGHARHPPSRTARAGRGRPARPHRAEVLRRNDVHRVSSHVQRGSAKPEGSRRGTMPEAGW